MLEFVVVGSRGVDGLWSGGKVGARLAETLAGCRGEVAGIGRHRKRDSNIDR